MQKTRVTFAFLMSFSFVAGANAAPAAPVEKPNQLTKEEKKAGWKLLFDGKTLKGWRGYKKPDAPDGWKVVDGAITRVDKAGDLITAAEYQDFELSLDWNIVEKGNSGVMYHVTESQPNSYQTGPEMQVADPANGDGSNPLTAAGSCYALYPAKKDVTKPAGSWNRAKIVISNNHVEHWMNGEKIAEYTLGSDDWNAKVGGSKFSTMPDFGKAPKGFIAIQDHGDKVAYKNIKILVPSDKKPAAKKPAKK